MSDFPTPTLADVGALIVARTKEEMTRKGTFTADTQPTAEQVLALIARARGRVEIALGTAAAGFTNQARELVAIYTAMLVERSYFPENLEGSASLYQELKADYEDGVKALIAASTDDTPGVKGIYSVPLRTEISPPVTS